LLRRLIEEHLHYTNSVPAGRILEEWDSALTQFVRVMPVDYRRALERLAAETESEA
jgi:glutamate synthase domain-containing protein 3